jgi:hypothetical protein
MATHDYVIDNQTAPNFRADVNNALLAIVSQNSNATAPSVTYANMFWYDTANNQLKKRNEANSDWITLGTIDEGTGTFTPSGERALSSQAQAEAGSDNTTLMTPLRSAQAIAAQVGSATAGLAAGDVGSYAFLHDVNNNAARAAGSTVAGSNLLYSAVGNAGANVQLSNNWISASGTPSGTWRLMGSNTLNGVYEHSSLWLRIS